MDDYTEYASLVEAASSGDAVSLYFDAVPRFLDLFERHGIRATFFMIGRDSRSADHRRVIREIADDKSFFEPHRAFAKNITVGFIRLDGRPVGVVANNPKVLSGALNISASEKGARFVRAPAVFPGAEGGTRTPTPAIED